ncbi:ribonuclease H-like domain-containing protein [Tanacetum coccineum]|uniref:Ribonuclease H-like domain-containing protein n=1 Tax=Tanacetum coccineum TaxID=301880 RepID=A0ABQ4YS35_9ASTR
MMIKMKISEDIRRSPYNDKDTEDTEDILKCLKDIICSYLLILFEDVVTKKVNYHLFGVEVEFYREMITSQLQGKLWLYDEVRTRLYIFKLVENTMIKMKISEDIRRSPYNDKDTEDTEDILKYLKDIIYELKFNLFSVSQMCDKKNSVLFTEIECLIMSPSFKLFDESQVVLRAPRKDDVYSLNLKNIVPSGVRQSFKNHAMNEFCAKKGIKREFSVARTPQQNGTQDSYVAGSSGKDNASLNLHNNYYSALDDAKEHAFEEEEKTGILHLKRGTISKYYPVINQNLSTGRSSGSYCPTRHMLVLLILPQCLISNNMDDTINVSTIPTTQIHKNYPKDQILGDPNVSQLKQMRRRKDSKVLQHNMHCFLQDRKRWLKHAEKTSTCCRFLTTEGLDIVDSAIWEKRAIGNKIVTMEEPALLDRKSTTGIAVNFFGIALVADILAMPRSHDYLWQIIILRQNML